MIDADDEPVLFLQTFDQRLAHAGIRRKNHAAMPGPDDPLQTRRKGINRDKRAAPCVLRPLRQQILDRRVVGRVDFGDAPLALADRKAGIAGHEGAIGGFDDGIDVREIAIDVKNEAGNAAVNQRRVHERGEAAADRQRARVPSGMFEEVIRPQPQQSVTSGQMIGGVVANQYDGRRRLGSLDCDRNLWSAGGRRLVHEDLPTVGAVPFLRTERNRSFLRF